MELSAADVLPLEPLERWLSWTIIAFSVSQVLFIVAPSLLLCSPLLLVLLAAVVVSSSKLPASFLDSLFVL
jgi:hypothetical protein